MISFVRGPVNGPFPASVKFCAPDADVPEVASGLVQIPVLSSIDKLRSTDHVVYLEGHRAPPGTLDALRRVKCTVVVHGDPTVLCSTPNDDICAELSKLPALERSIPLNDMVETVEDALAASEGYTRVLCSNRDNKDLVMKHLRPNNSVMVGDSFHCWKRGYRAFSSVNLQSAKPSTMVRFTCGRSAPMKYLNRTLVETPHSWGSGECDTLVILPDVSEHVGYAACARVRYKVISVGIAPSLYLTPPTAHDG